jgi:biopolymer transport protein TolQ
MRLAAIGGVMLWSLVAVGSAAAAAGPAQGVDLWHLMLGSGWTVRVVLLILGSCSVATWGIAGAKEIELRRAKEQSERFIKVFWDAKNLAAIQAASSDLEASPVAQVFRAGYKELLRYTRARRGDDEIDFGGIENVQRAMSRARTEELTRLEHGLTFLATTASTAPFVGLFGTVWGIMTAFMGLSAETSSSIQAVAPGIAEALIATAVGLAAAIPAVVMHNRFARHVRVLTADMETFASEFLNIAERHLIRK